jgi:hypothetical protein
MVAALSLKEKNQDTINQAIAQLQQGRDNGSGTVTLTTGTSTAVPAVNCSPTSGVQLTAATSDAALALAAGTMWVSAVGKGQFTITHAAGAADRTFFYRIHGGN